MRTEKLAHESPHGLADGGHLEVELTSLGRRRIVGFACPEIVGFEPSTEDVGHGAGSFAFRTAERALAQGVLPGTISSDLHQGNVNGPVYDLATTLSKFLHLGVSLEEVIRRVTTNAAKALAFPSGIGSLAVGSIADVAVFELREAPWDMVDSVGETRQGTLRLRPMATVKAGHIYGNSAIPIHG